MNPSNSHTVMRNFMKVFISTLLLLYQARNSIHFISTYSSLNYSTTLVIVITLELATVQSYYGITKR